VAERISELKAEQTKRTKIEADDILRRLVRIAEKTEQEGDYNAAIRSLELLGKHQAMWTEKNITEMNVQNAFSSGNSEEDIERDVERLKKIATPKLKLVKKESVH
jgi:adenine specific DNA methylase Mod